MKVLGIWDGHDAGAALIDDGHVVFAVNEERFTRRKLEIGFPEISRNCCGPKASWLELSRSFRAISSTIFLSLS